MTKATDCHIAALRTLVEISERHKPTLAAAEVRQVYRIKQWLRERDEKPLGAGRTCGAINRS